MILVENGGEEIAIVSPLYRVNLLLETLKYKLETEFEFKKFEKIFLSLFWKRKKISPFSAEFLKEKTHF